MCSRGDQVFSFLSHLLLLISRTLRVFLGANAKKEFGFLRDLEKTYCSPLQTGSLNTEYVHEYVWFVHVLTMDSNAKKKGLTENS